MLPDVEPLVEPIEPDVLPLVDEPLVLPWSS